jgi:hypothetical protein
MCESVNLYSTNKGEPVRTDSIYNMRFLLRTYGLQIIMKHRKRESQARANTMSSFLLQHGRVILGRIHYKIIKCLLLANPGYFGVCRVSA